MPKNMPTVAALLLSASALAAPAAAPQGRAPAPEPVFREQTWHPPAGAIEVPLWPAEVAIARPEVDGPEKVAVGGSIAGRPLTGVRNVTRPTMAIFPAKGRNTGAALMVYPGGGYQGLAIDFEGTEVCDWITAKGVTCVVLKYRVPQAWWHSDCHCQRAPKIQMALQDAQRAMALLRRRAASLGVDPHRIGVLGFSAGGHLVTAISNAAARTYDAVDEADRESLRPDFAVALYPGHLWSEHGVELYPFDPVSSKAPPTFILQAEDDPVDDVRNSIAYFLGLRAAEVKVEMHIYAEGGHAFGLRPTDKPITRWPALVEAWLHTIGMI